MRNPVPQSIRAIAVLAGTAALAWAQGSVPTSAFTASPASLAFSYRLGAAAPVAQTVRLTSSPASTLGFGAFADVATPVEGSWLDVSPGEGSTPADLVVTVDPTGLGVGTYSGAVVVSGFATNSPLRIPVSLSVLPALTVAPTSLAFTYRINGPTPASQPVSVSSGGSPAPVTAVVATSPVATWLSVAPGSGTTPVTFNASVTPGGLSAGTYNGVIRITATDAANGFRDVPVTLTVLPALSVAPTSLTFTYRINGTAPGSQTFVASSGGSPVAVNAVASTTPAGGTWLAVVPAGGTTPATFTVSVAPCRVDRRNVQRHRPRDGD